MAIQELEKVVAFRRRWIAPRELDRLVDHGFKIKDEYVGVGASGQIFTAEDLQTGQDVAIKVVRGIYSHPRVAQNLWREEKRQPHAYFPRRESSCGKPL